ncbi:MAG TPA: hypothetical protein VFG69_16125 [Nannocystaceae bacterium]|nr:hypothetical protein [Nannocystaceae bacterium]
MNMRLAGPALALVLFAALAPGCGDDSSATSGPDTSSSDSTSGDSTSITITTDGSSTSIDASTSTDSTTAVDSSGQATDSSSGASVDTTQGATESTGTGDGGTTSGGTEESTGTAGSSSEEETGEPVLPDISGDHLLAVSIAISPETPLQYIATIVQTPDGDGALLDVELQRLTLNVGSTTDPRDPFGPPIVIDDVAVAADGTFSLSIPVLDVPGETNPITGGDAAAANVILDGTIMDDDFFCGTMDGDLTAPLMVDLVGSTFAGTRLLLGNLPNVFEWSC